MAELSLSAFFAVFISAVYLNYPESVDPSLRTHDTPQTDLDEEYDFIVVGAGSAGCVLANRLTELPDWKVLLVEAGGDETPTSDAPLLSPFTHGTEMDWNYTTVKQDNACLSSNGICQYPRGRAMGGSSSINAMLYVRGNKIDYDDWAEKGNDGWSYKDVLPYFIKAENAVKLSLTTSPFRGDSGYLNVQFPNYVTPMREVYIKAAQEFGWARGDYNGERQDLVGYVQLTVNGSSRANTAKAYLNPIRHRKNLSVIKKTTVTKILINNKMAVGIEYYREGKKHIVSARKEIIISAGSIDTPKLLLLSGVGPEDELEKHNITLNADLPVGKNLQDHLQLPVMFEINSSETITTSLWRTNKTILEYAIERSGPLTTNGLEAMAFLNTNNIYEQPNLQFTWVTTSHITSKAPQSNNIITLLLSNVKPKSIGLLRLNSPNWHEAPLIDPNYFSDPADFDVFRKGVQYAFDFIKTPTISQFSPTLHTESQPACKGMKGAPFIDCLIHQYSSTIYHPVGTAKMGQGKDAVVNNKLQVHGIPNLRVIDASIMPSIPGGNTNAPTIMIAEKGSDIIKELHAS